MRNKIGLLMIATLMVVILSACSSNNLVEEVELEEYPIEFSSTTQNATRASVTNNSELANADGFYVWGWKTKTQTPLDWSDASCYKVFDKVNVYCSGNNGAYNADDYATNWTYATPQFWDRKCTYTFYAAGPAKGAANLDGTLSLVGDDNSDKHFEIIGATGISSTDSKFDYVINRNPVSHVGTDAKNVDFSFHHVMSKICVGFKTDINDCTITVTDLKMTGWSNALYDFTQDPDYAGGMTMSEWTLNQGSDNKANTNGSAIFLKGANLQFGNDVKDDDGNNLPATVSASTYWVMVPQVVNNLTFTVSYTIKYSDGVVDTFKNVVSTVSNQSWYTDCWTTYLLTVSPNPIRFNVSSVAWTGNSDATIIVQ